MVIVWGQRMYGRIDKLAGSYVGTRFFHIYYLPLIPLSSWLVLEEQGQGSFVGTQVPLQLRSVLAAWLRIFGTLYFVVCMAALLSSPVELSTTHLTSFLQIGLVGALTAFAWLRLGRLSALERAARVAYADHVGRFVDPALLEQRAGIKAQAIEQLDKHLARHATATYREAPQAQWKEIATRPDMRDVPLLVAALTRCRIEAVESRGAARAELEQAHGKILANLVAAKPELLSGAVA